MSGIISSKNGRLHIYVRQDKYKGKLKSENWVGRTFHNGRQKDDCTTICLDSTSIRLVVPITKSELLKPSKFL